MSKSKESIVLNWTPEETQEKTHQIYQGSTNRTFYEILGISEGATQEQIKKAYEKSSKEIDSIVVSKTFKLTGKDYIKILTTNLQAKADYDNSLKVLRDGKKIPLLDEKSEAKRKQYTQNLTKNTNQNDTIKKKVENNNKNFKEFLKGIGIDDHEKISHLTKEQAIQIHKFINNDDHTKALAAYEQTVKDRGKFENIRKSLTFGGSERLGKTETTNLIENLKTNISQKNNKSYTRG